MAVLLLAPAEGWEALRAPQGGLWPPLKAQVGSLPLHTLTTLCIEWTKFVTGMECIALFPYIITRHKHL